MWESTSCVSDLDRDPPSEANVNDLVVFRLPESSTNIFPASCWVCVLLPAPLKPLGSFFSNLKQAFKITSKDESKLPFILRTNQSQSASFS